MAQWLRIRLPIQGTRVLALVWKDPTCRRATKPMRHNYWACTLEPVSHNYWVCAPQLLKPTRLEPVLCNKRSHHYEKPAHCNGEWPPLATTRGSPHAVTKTQRSQKWINKINKFIKKETSAIMIVIITSEIYICVQEATYSQKVLSTLTL